MVKNFIHRFLGLAVLAGAVLSAGNVGAYTQRATQQALAVDDKLGLYSPDKNKGFGVSGGFFSGRASGVDDVSLNGLGGALSSDNDHAAELEADQRV